MRSPKVVRSRIQSGNNKSPNLKMKQSKIGKENMGLSHASSKVTKVRPVPDFGKLHKKWESQLNMNKAQAKKPLTTVQEFAFCKPGAKKENLPMKELHSNTSSKIDMKKVRRAEQKNTLKEISRTPTQTLENKKDGHSNISQALPDQVADCDRDSFGTLANIQQEFGIAFEEDQNALQSILNSTGVSDSSLKDAKPNVTAASESKVRQTVGGSEFKAPLCPSMRQTQQAMRKSIYYTGPSADSFSKQFVYSEFARRMASRLTLDANTPKPVVDNGSRRKRSYLVSSPAPKVINQRHSIYVKVDYGQQLKNKPVNISPSKEIRIPASEKKAQRVLSKTPLKSPAVRLTKSTGKKKPLSQWKDLLGPRSPQVKVQLFQDDENYEDENEPLAQKIDDNIKLKEIEEVEKKLQKEIDEMELKKRVNEPVIGPDSPAFNRPAPSTPSNQQKHHQRTPVKSVEKKNVAVASPNRKQQHDAGVVAKPKRMALGELNDQEVAIRSSPSYREQGRSRQKHKSAPTHAACVFGSKQKTPSKKVHFGEVPNVLKHPESPSARYHQKCLASDQGLESPRSRVAAIRKASRYSPIGGARSPKARDYSPTSRLRDSQSYQVYNMMAELDKENASPLRHPMKSVPKGKNIVVTPSKRTIIREEETEFVVEYDDLLEESIHNMSVEDINQTIHQSEAVMEDLQKEEQSLMEQSVILEQSNLDETTGNATIMEQMDLIQKKQQELMALQKALQEKLDKRKSKKAHGKEKRKLVFGSKSENSQDKKQSQVSSSKLNDRAKENGGLKSTAVSSGKVTIEKNVVDVSPIVLGGPTNSDLNTGFGSNVFLTPEQGSAKSINNRSHGDNYDFDSPTIFPTRKQQENNDHNKSLKQPLHSTAHESQYHLELEKSPSHVLSPVQEQVSASSVNDNGGGLLSQGLLQMAQNLNATPHKSKHWKKQYLNTDQQQMEAGENHSAEFKDSFYENGDNVQTPKSAQKPYFYQPIGTPRSPGLNFAAMTINTPTRVLKTPLSEKRKTPLGYSPKSLFSGSAQLLMTSPIQTPLALREALGTTSDRRTSMKGDLSIDGSADISDVHNESLTDLCMKSQKYSSPPRSNRKPVQHSMESGSLSLAANLKQSPVAFESLVPRQPRKLQTPACNDLQQTLFSKVKVKYMDAVADNEVSLYNSSLQSKTSLGFNIRCHNPVSKILLEGDEFHFVPIVEPVVSPPRIVPSVGSAFSASSAFRQIRV